MYSTFQSFGWCRLLDSQCGLKEITFLIICTSSVPHIALAGFKNAVSSRDNDAKCMALKKHAIYYSAMLFSKEHNGYRGAALRQSTQKINPELHRKGIEPQH